MASRPISLGSFRLSSGSTRPGARVRCYSPFGYVSFAFPREIRGPISTLITYRGPICSLLAVTFDGLCQSRVVPRVCARGFTNLGETSIMFRLYEAIVIKIRIFASLRQSLYLFRITSKTLASVDNYYRYSGHRIIGSL